MNKGVQPENLRALIDWYRMAGVDALLSDNPTDWFKASAAPPPAAKAPPASARPAHPVHTTNRAPQAHANRNLAASSPAQAVMDARTLAAEAKTLEEVRHALNKFDGCALKKLAKNLCFADGAPTAPVMFVGEAPGRDEDLSGVPFVGRAGQLFNLMLAAVDMVRERDIWITNTVFWRPPGNRTPSLEETEICRPFLERQIELIEPKIIVALGGAAAKHLLQTSSGIMRLRGRWQDVEIAGRSRTILPTLHPAYLLRNPSAKKLAWRDFLAIRERLDAARATADTKPS